MPLTLIHIVCVSGIALVLGANQTVDLAPAAQRSLKDLLAVPLTGDNAERKAEAYKDLFLRIAPGDLAKLRSSPDLSLALQARFEQATVPPPPDPKLQKGDIVVPTPNYDFESFFARRVGYGAPGWWGHGFRVPPGPDFGRGFNSGGMGPHTVLPKNLLRRVNGDRITVGDGTHQITVVNEGQAHSLYVVFAPSRAYVELYEAMAAYPSQLYAYDTGTGKLVWQRKIWGNYRGGFAGYGVHDLTVELHNGQVVVYGVGSGSYADAFQQSDGQPVFRFSSTYWGNAADGWDLPWRKPPGN